MIYLTGATNDAIEPALIARGFGIMCQPGNSYHLRAHRYPFTGYDNGCFGGRWEEDSWVDWLSAMPIEHCLFAVAPDVYPDAAESLRRGLEWAPFVRELGLPAAVVAQDGAEKLTWTWEDIDCLFVGGERRFPGRLEWKESEAAAELVKQARNAGKWVHMGRVNTPRRLWRAWRMGVLSADGTLVKYLRRKRAGESDEQRDVRFLRQLDTFAKALGHCPLPLDRWETPSVLLHRQAQS